MELTKVAGPWIGILLGLLFALAAAGEALRDVNDTSYFSEGGNLSSNLSLVKRKVTPRNKAESASLPENGTQEGVGPKDFGQEQLSTVEKAQHNLSEATHREYSQQTLTLKSNAMPKLNLSTTESTGHIATVTLNTTGAGDKPVDSSMNSTVAPAAGKKSKPAVTFDIEDLPKDENGNVIVSKENLVGAGPSFDFVVPIVIALLAVPFVAVLGAYIYKQSRDFWDRRHYRRMDFLIDGMYND